MGDQIYFSINVEAIVTMQRHPAHEAWCHTLYKVASWHECIALSPNCKETGKQNIAGRQNCYCDDAETEF